MKATDANRPDAIDEAKLGAVDHALQEAFGVRFDFWIRAEAWSRVSRGNITPDPDYAAALAKSLSELGDRESEPRTSQLPDGRPLLIVPVGCLLPKQVIAAAVFPGCPTDLLCRYAKLFLNSFAHQQELAQLQHENASLVKQVSDDFEELAFLRHMADFVEVADMSDGLARMAEFVFPLLNKSIQAETLVFVRAVSDASASTDPDSRAVHCIGSGALDEDIVLRLVNQYSRESQHGPLVKNGQMQTCDFPNVRNFILTRVSGTNEVLGWLLAVNRTAESVPHHNDLADSQLLASLEFGTVEASLLSTSASILGACGKNCELLREKEQLLVNMVRVMVSAIEAKDAYTCGHSERVALFAARLSEELGLSSADRERVYLAGLLHDIGKIGVPDELLLKETGLTEQEYEQIKRHPDQGWKILYGLEQLRYVLPGILYHHEHFNGSGYPDGLAGEDIPIDGRILAVADTYDAMTSDRPYRQGLPEPLVVELFQGGTGKQWDPQVVAALFRAMPDITRIRESYLRPTQPRRESNRPKAVDDSNLATIEPAEDETTIHVGTTN